MASTVRQTLDITNLYIERDGGIQYGSAQLLQSFITDKIRGILQQYQPY